MSSGSLTSWWQRKRRAHNRTSSPRTPLRWAPSCFVPAASHVTLIHGIGSQGPIPLRSPACMIGPNHMSPAGCMSCLLPFTLAAPIKCRTTAAFHIRAGADRGGPGGAPGAGRAAGGVAGGGPRAVRQAGDSVQTFGQAPYMEQHAHACAAGPRTHPLSTMCTSSYSHHMLCNPLRLTILVFVCR